MDHFVGWKKPDPEDLPDAKLGPCLITNNAKALNAHGMPSHVWLVGMLHKDDDGSVTAFSSDSDRRILGVELYRPAFVPFEEV